MVSIFKGNYASEVGFFVTRKQKLWSIYNDRIGEHSFEGHARSPSEIKKKIFKS
jgi:hypothetical protein